MLFAYLVKDILWLRVLTVVGCTFDFFYMYLGTESPVWVYMGWNVAFISINSLQIGLLLKEMFGYKLTPEEEHLYQCYFREMNRLDFVKVIKLAEWRTVSENTILITQGETVKEITLIQRGSLAIDIQNRTVAQLTVGQLIGEMSFVTGEPATATIRVDSETAQILVWSQQELRYLIEKNTEMRIIMQSFFNKDLMKKLQQRSAQQLATINSSMSE
jgi:hypothetical protein